MGREIDEKVVEMRFDNKQFESATKETLGTLERLKQALKLPNLKDSLSGIDEAAKKTKLDGIASAVEALEKRFSTLGIVGMRVIENLTDAVMNKLQRALSFVSDSIVSGGVRRAMNIENAHFQLQALLKDELKVQAVMADAMESVDGTAYAYDEAAKAASQFAASGVQAGEDMLNALKGITGVAAMTNSDFESISRIFTTVAGNGRLMGDQLLQLSSRGLNAASTIADYFKEVRGQANMTEGTIREMVSKGQLDFKTFSDAMTWAFGDSAKRANETFTGAMSNMKSALARIGAEFVSPFIEQNSEMVKLFNALRIQINNVKSALTFNEQRSAIAGLRDESSLLVETISQFVKDGTMNFEDFTSEILKTKKSEEELAEINSILSESYEAVRESGSASVDTLMEFNRNGVKATDAVKDYINGVLTGSIQVSKEVRASIKEISDGIQVTNADVYELAENGKISFDIFTDAIVNASGAIEKGSKVSEEALTNMFSKVKKAGSLTLETFIEFQNNGINAAKALVEYMNGVQNGSIRASYATTTAIEEITGGSEVLAYQIREMAEQGVISYDIFQSALENMYGTEKALSKQFTDFVLDNVKQLVTYVQNVDLTKPLEAFYYVVESGKNILKGFYSIVKPIGQAFSEVFLGFNGDTIVSLGDKLETITSKLRLSDKGSNNLRKAFKGVFDVAKLLIDIFIKLVKAIIPMNAPILETGDGLLGLAGSAGEALSKFSEWVRSSTRIKNVYNMLADTMGNFAKHVSKAVAELFDFIKYLSELPVVEKLIRATENSFNNFLDGIGPFFDSLGEKAKNFKETFIDLLPESVINLFGNFRKEVSKMVEEFNNLEVNDLGDVLDFFVEKFKKFIEFVTSNDALNKYVLNIKYFFRDLGEAFSLESVSDKIEKTLELLQKMTDFFKDIFGKVFEDFSFGGLVAGGSGIALIIALFKGLKTFEKMSNTINFVPKTLGTIRDALVAYQNNLNADAIWKIAKSIAILAGSLILLSFTDMDKLALVSIGLSGTAYAIMNGIAALTKTVKTARVLETAISDLIINLGKSLKNFSKALKKFAIGSMVKNFALSIGIIAATIVGLGYMWQQDQNVIIAGGIIVSVIMVIVGAMIAGLSILGEKFQKGMLAFEKVTRGIISLAASVAIMVFAINMIMKMEIPTDGRELGIKVGLLITAVLSLGGLVIALGYASRVAMSMKIKSGPILAAAASLILVAKAFTMLMGIEVGSDWDAKCELFGGLMVGVGALCIAVGHASRLAGGALKGAGTIVALAVFMVVAVGALALLSLIDPLKLIAPTIALGVVLVALAAALYGAGQITEKANWKSILAMGINIGVIMAALGILVNVPIEKLAPTAKVLFASLVGLALALLAAGKISDQVSFESILAMSGAVIVLAVSLYALAEQPWEGIAAGAAGLTATMLAFAGMFAIISKSGGMSAKQIASFIAMCIPVIALTGSLYILSGQPWEALLAGAVALGGVMLAMAACFAIVGKTKVSIETAISFVAASIALLPVAIALSMISDYSWDALIASAAGLAIASVGLAGALFIVGASNINLGGVLSFVAASVALIPIAYAITMIAEVPIEDCVKAIVSLAAALTILGIFTTVMSPLATGMILLSVGLLAFGVAIGVVGVGLNVFVQSLIEAMSAFITFFSMLDPDTFYQIGYNIVMGLIQGIMGGLGALLDVLGEIVNNGIIGTVCNLLGIHSPSDIFDMIGRFLDMGFAEGVLGGSGMISDSMTSVFGNLADYVKPNTLFEPGKEAASNFAKGVENNKIDIAGMVASVVGEANDEVDTEDFTETGEEAATNFMTGFTGMDSEITNQINEMMSQVGMDVDMSSMFNIGELGAGNLFEGFSSGEFDFSSMISGAFSSAGEGVDYTPLQLTGQEGSTQFVQTFEDTTKESLPETSKTIADSLARSMTDAIHEANFTKQGETLITEFLRAFPRSESTTKEKASLLMEYVIKEIQNKNLVFERAGTESVEHLLIGIGKRYNLANTTGIELADKIIDALKSKFTDFQTKGVEISDRIISGIKSRFNEGYNTASEFASRMLLALTQRLNEFHHNGTQEAVYYISGISDQYGNSYNTGENLARQALIGLGVLTDTFYDYGVNAGQGFVNGLNSKAKDVKAVAASIGNAAAEATRKALDEHSPSRVFDKIGQFATEGLANGLISKLSLVENAGNKVSNSAIDLVKDSITSILGIIQDEDMSADLTLTPKVDLSYVKDSARDISELFNNAVENQNLKVSGIAGTFKYKNAESESSEADMKSEDVKNLLTKLNEIQNQPKQENTFYVTGDDPKAIAEEVSVILQKQYTRRSKTWE